MCPVSNLAYQLRNGTETLRLDLPLHRYLSVLGEDERMVVAQASVLNPRLFFCPNGKQEEFIELVANSVKQTSIPVVLFTAANGIGKTTISLHIMLNIIYGAQNGWFDYDIFINYPFPKLAWYITTRSAIENVIVKEIERLFEAGTYTLDKRGKPYVSAVHFANGWELVFFTQDQDVSQMESATVGLIIGDEPFTSDIWKALKSRRRMGCLTILPMTPLDVEPFIIDEVDKLARAGNKGYFRLSASVYDACIRRGVRGHLAPDIIDDMVSSYDEDERQSRVYGEFMYFSERIYSGLAHDKHWVKPDDYPVVKTAQFYHVVDPHDGRPAAVIWGFAYPIPHSDEYRSLIAAKKAKQQIRRVIYAEYPLETHTPFWDMKDSHGHSHSRSVEQWIDIEDDLRQNYGVSTSRRILDRVFGWQTRNSNTIANVFLEESRRRGKPMLFKPSYHSKGGQSEIAYGHSVVRECLQDLEDGRPGLVIWDTCWHTWNGLTHYVRKRAKNSDINKAAGETKIVEKYKDFPDAVRFFCCDPIIYRSDEDGSAENTENKKTNIRRKHRQKKDLLAALGKQVRLR